MWEVERSKRATSTGIQAQDGTVVSSPTPCCPGSSLQMLAWAPRPESWLDREEGRRGHIFKYLSGDSAQLSWSVAHCPLLILKDVRVTGRALASRRKTQKERLVTAKGTRAGARVENRLHTLGPP